MSSPSDLICNFERNPYNVASPILTRKIECRAETLNHGRLLYHNRSHAEDGLQDVWGRLFCNDRSGAETLDPWAPATQQPKPCGRRVARRPGGRLFCNDRAGGETLNHGRLPRNNRSLAEDGLQDVRGTSVLQRPKRSGDLGPMGTRSASASKIKKG